LLSLSYWVSASVLIGEKPFEIRVLEEQQQELNENLISAQILASQLDRVFTLFQENLALSKSDSLADDASLVPLANRTCCIARGSDAEIERSSTGAGINSVTMFLVVKNLVLVLSWSIVDAAVASLGHFPLKPQFKVIWDLLSRVGQPSPFPFTG